MKKQNNISALVKQTYHMLLMVSICMSCTEDIFDSQKAQVEEGLPVSIDFQFAASSLDKVTTRSLTQEQEWKMNDLYLLIFDKDGKIKEGTHYYPETELTNHYNYQDGRRTPTNGTLTSIETTSGESYIYGVANVGANELGGGTIRKQLEGVETISDLKKIEATLTNAGNIDRTTANLVMSGAFQANISQENEGKCIIPATDGKLAGELKLQRLDSHIIFNIKINNSEITSYTFDSWQVFNVPMKSNLILQETDAVAANDDDYTDSSIQNQFIKADDGGNTFDFYMLENRKNAKNGITSNEYAKREKEEKDNNNLNYDRPEYTYVEGYATYVEIKGKLQFTKKDQETAYYRYANVRYIVHLGYAGNDATDFKSERNKEYTYHISIEDVDKIILEVTDGDEQQPGAEGDVVDAKAQIYELDAHYSCFNIGFTWKEIEDFTFQVKTPFGSIDQNATEAQKAQGDYQWIKLRYSNNRYNSDKLAEYSKEKMIDLFALKEDMRKQGADKEINTTYYYTLYIDEYFYENPPADLLWDTPYWKHFVNKENREALLLLSPQISTDGNSSYANARYLITQKSIQTYYDIAVFNDDRTALGMEHFNETEETPDMELTYNPVTWSDDNGAWNTWRYLQQTSKNWKNYCNITTANPKMYTFKMNQVKAWAECLSRNRDEDNDGIIDQDELKWYLPTHNQLASMFLGAPSLATPLFDANSINQISDDENTKTQYHYATSSGEKVWSEEGCSFGGTNAKTLRCVRNLGKDNGANDKGNSVKPAYIYDRNTRTFTMRMNEKNIRSGFIEDAEIPAHNNFSPNNRPYQKFQVAEKFAKNIEAGGRWSNFLLPYSDKSVCATYEESGSKKGDWRAPNQRELLIMYVQDPSLVINTINTNYGSYSCTHWKYNTARQFGINTYFSTPVFYLDKGYNFGPATLRCVRDVD